jgi:DNA polymerase III subunit epsilon
MAKYHASDRDDSILWSRNVLEKKNSYVILDTETTGLEDEDEIIQMAIIDLEKNVLYNTLLKPKLKKSISRDATMIHGIKKNDLIDAPYFETAVHKFLDVTENKTILIYNAEFDIRLLQQTCYANRIKKFPLSCWCVMKEYSKYVGEWNEYHQNYRLQKLKGGDHTALGDCLATLTTIEVMAKSKTAKELKPEPIQEMKSEKKIEAITITQPDVIQSSQKVIKKWWQFWN